MFERFKGFMKRRGITVQVFIAMAMLITAIVSVWQIAISNKQIKMSEKTLMQQYEFNKMNLRPYLMVEDINSKVEIVQKNNEFKFTANVRNYGSTPAYSVSYNGFMSNNEISLDSVINRFSKDISENDTRIYIPQDKSIPFIGVYSMEDFTFSNYSDIIKYWKENSMYEYIHIEYYDEMDNEYNFITAWEIELEKINNKRGIIKVKYLWVKSF